MENFQGLSEEELVKLHDDLKNKQEDFKEKISQCKIVLQEEEGELQKRYYRLERMRENCGDTDKKLLAFLEENQKHFHDINKKLIEQLKEIDLIVSKRNQEWEAKQEDILYWIQKKQEEKRGEIENYE